MMTATYDCPACNAANVEVDRRQVGQPLTLDVEPLLSWSAMVHVVARKQHALGAPLCQGVSLVVTFHWQ